MSCLSLVFDQLPTSCLSCYGSHLVTPRIDTLAAVSDIFTMCYADASTEPWTSTIKAQKTISISEYEQINDFWRNFTFDSTSLVIRFKFPTSSLQADHLVGGLLEIFPLNSPNRPAIVFTSLQGEPGNDGWAGAVGEQAAHVPLMVSLPGQQECRRRDELLTTTALPQLLTSLSSSEETYRMWRDELHNSQVTYGTDHWRAVRTHGWLLIQSKNSPDDEFSEKLFRKPDDLWEILDVANQYPSIVEDYRSTGQLSFPTETC